MGLNVIQCLTQQKKSQQLPTQVLWLFNQSQLVRGQRRTSGKALLALQLRAGGSKNKKQVLSLAPQNRGRAGWASSFLIWGEGRDVSRGQAGKVAQVIYSPLCGVECWGHAQHPVLLPTPSFCSRIFRNGSWDFCLLVQNLPQLHMHHYFYSRIISLYFLAQGQMCPGASIAACIKGSQVPGLTHDQSQV